MVIDPPGNDNFQYISAILDQLLSGGKGSGLVIRVNHSGFYLERKIMLRCNRRESANKSCSVWLSGNFTNINPSVLLRIFNYQIPIGFLDIA